MKESPTKGDFTRQTFAETITARCSPSRAAYSSTRTGTSRRSQVHLDRLTNWDVVGAHGTPIDVLTGSSGMEIVDGVGLRLRGTPTSGLWISPGHYYVGGALASNQARVRVTHQPDLPGVAYNLLPRPQPEALWLHRHRPAAAPPDRHTPAKMFFSTGRPDRRGGDHMIARNRLGFRELCPASAHQILSTTGMSVWCKPG